MTKEELTEQIAQLARTYVPEWRFDLENPDAGTAAALIFAEMFYGNIKRCERMPEKLRRSFFGQTGLCVLPAAAAEGYVTFGLSSHEFGGARLPERTVVLGKAKETGDDVAYETTEALYVTPAQLVHVVYTDGQEDRIEYRNLDRPFAPFTPGEENLQEHVLYLAQSEVLQVAGDAEIRLELVSADGDLEWLADEERLSVSYAARGGFEAFRERRLDGQCLVLKKDRAQPAPEETELFGVSGCWLCCRCLGAWDREPFHVSDIRMTAKRDDIEPDLIQTDLGAQPAEHVLPFGEEPMLFRECYFASDEALGKKGANVRLTFELSYEQMPFDNSVKVERAWKTVMKRADFVPDPEYDITVAQTVWEYYNGTGWSRLPVSEEAESVFDGSGREGNEKITIAFPCPDDAALLEWQCAPTRYIRVRVLRMENLYKLKGNYITPVLSNVRFHYSYVGDGKRPEAAVARNGLEEAIFPVGALGRKETDWTIFFGLHRQRRSLYLGFDQPLTEGPIRLYCALEDAGQESWPLSFEYYGKDGFLPLYVVDGTKSLQKSGCLTIAGNQDFAPCTVCGRRAFWIRITDETDACRRREGSVSWPRIAGMYLNTVKVEAKGERSMGEAGNQPAGGIDRLGSAHGYVSRVTNHMPICGGYGLETVSHAMRRGGSAMRHLGRGVTAGDYEALAKEASRLVQRARCYPGCNPRGEYEPGSITLIVLQREFVDGRMHFEKIREEITDYISRRVDPNVALSGHLYVEEPQFVRMDCDVKVVTADVEHAFAVQQKAKRKLEQFIHPVTGNYHGHGWEIGTVPNETQIVNALKELDEILFVREARITAERQKRAGAQDARFAVALSGRHTVWAEVE